MTDFPVERAISLRARKATDIGRSSSVAVPAIGVGPDPGLLETLRHHLHAGETHYPARPGMVPLRERLDDRLAELGLPSRGAASVLITASEGEALFVTLLGLGVVPGGTIRGEVSSEHFQLLSWTGVTVLAAEGDGEVPSTPKVMVIGATLFSAHLMTIDPTDVVVGSLDGLDGMQPFRLGFVAGDPDTIAAITKWKQASSICAPSPSQRAALWALGVEP